MLLLAQSLVQEIEHVGWGAGEWATLLGAIFSVIVASCVAVLYVGTRLSSIETEIKGMKTAMTKMTGFFDERDCSTHALKLEQQDGRIGRVEEHVAKVDKTLLSCPTCRDSMG